MPSFQTVYQTRSKVETTCGFVYQYQFIVDLNFNIAQIAAVFSLATPGVTWNLLSFNVEVGCSGFTISTSTGKCNDCLGGFFPSRSTDGLLYGCGLCDSRCNTCSARNTCILCESYASFNQTTNMCEYSPNFIFYENVTVITGSSVNGSGVIHRVKSSLNQILKFNLSLTNNQSYFIKFYLIYTSAFADGLQRLTINLNDDPTTTQNFTSLDRLSSTLY